MADDTDLLELQAEALRLRKRKALAMAAAPAPPEPQEASEGAATTFGKGLARGALDVGASVLNAPENIANLAKAAYGYGGHQLGLLRTDQMPEVRQPEDMLGSTVSRLIQQNIDLRNKGDKFYSTLGELTGAGVAGGGAAGVLEHAPLQAAKQLALNVAAPAVGGAVGEQLGGAPGQVVGALAGGFAPTVGAMAARGLARGGVAGRMQMQKNIGALEQAGLGDKFTVGQAATGTPMQRVSQGLEATVSQAPGGVGPMADVAEQQAQALAAQKQAAIDAVGGVTEKSVAGRAVAKTLEPYIKSQSGQYKRLNDIISSKFAPEEPIAVSNYQKALNELSKADSPVRSQIETIIGDKVGTLKDQLAQDVKGAGTAFSETPGLARLPYQGVKDLRSTIGEAIASPEMVGSIGVGKLKKLYGALSDDMETAANSHGVGEVLRRQNAFWSRHMDRVENFVNAAADKQFEPEKIISWAMAGSKEGPSRLAEMRKAVSDPQVWQQVASTAVEDLGKGKTGVWQPGTFAANYAKLDPKAKNVLFSGLGDFRQNIEKVIDAQNLLSQGSKTYRNVSGSGPAIARQDMVSDLIKGVYAGATVGGGSLGGVAGAVAAPAAMLAGTHLSAKALSNPNLARWLAQSTTVSPEMARGHLGRLMQMSMAHPDAQTRTDAQDLYGRVAGIPGRAYGGPVDPGQPYVVGEQGPEVVVPTQPGTVIPSGMTGIRGQAPDPMVLAQNLPQFSMGAAPRARYQEAIGDDVEAPRPTEERRGPAGYQGVTTGPKGPGTDKAAFIAKQLSRGMDITTAKRMGDQIFGR